jgi:radical SAM protein with 4Fe4S-binding SPASM domain
MDNASQRLAFAVYLHGLGRWDAAAVTCRTVLAGVPAHVEALRLLGRVELDAGVTGEGAAALACALALDPADAETWDVLARAAGRGGRIADALIFQRRAWRLVPDPAHEESWRQAARIVCDRVAVLFDARDLAGVAFMSRLLLDVPDDVLRIRANAWLFNVALARRGLGLLRESVASIPLAADGSLVLSPLRVRIEVSSACNLRCRHCTTGIDYGGTDRRLMKMETFDRILDDISGFRHLQDCVMFLGGEPLLHPQFAAMCRRLADRVKLCDLRFTTNGMLLDETRCRDLAGSGVSQIAVSIDGRSPEENDDLRRGSSYAKIRDNVRMLVSHVVPAGVSVILSNIVIRGPEDPEQPGIPEFLRHDFPDLPIHSNYAMRWPGWTPPAGERSLESTVNPGRRTGFCLFPFTEMVVRPNGDVTLCCYDILGKEVVGNIFHNSLAALWNSPKIREIRLAMMTGQADGVSQTCRQCSVYSGGELAIRA